MTTWKPRPAATFDTDRVADALRALSAQEHFVLSRLHREASLPDLSEEIGIAPELLGGILSRLVACGAVEQVDELSPLRSAWPAACLGNEPRDAAAWVDPALDSTGTDVAQGSMASPPHDASDEAPNDDALDVEADANEDETANADARNYRGLYETAFRGLDPDARVAAASHATGAQLLALCFDPDPQVIRAVVQNPTVGFDHARLIAFHHKNPAGLESILARPELARDAQTHRRLLRNDQLSEPQLKRLLAGKRMMAVYKVTLDRDVPERSRVFSRGFLRQKFASSASEERAELIVQTEGRALALLSGQTFDSRTTSILCARPHTSTALIQNLARFAACPPQLLVHLVKLPTVRRQPQLKRMLLQHANMPSEIKRQLA